MRSQPRRPRSLRLSALVAATTLASLLAATAAENTQTRRITPPPALQNRDLPTTPAPDTVYLQETGEKIDTRDPLISVGSFRQTTFAGTRSGLLKLTDGSLQPVPGITNSIPRLIATRDSLWAVANPGLLRFDGTNWARVSSEPIVDLTPHRDGLVVATARQLWRFGLGNDRLESLSGSDTRFPITRVLSHQDSIFVHGTGRLTVFANGTFGARDVYDSRSDQSWDWGTLPSTVTRDALVIGPALYLATDRGLAIHRGMSLSTVAGPQGLPIEDTTCLAEGFDGDLWIGTSQGAVRRTGERFDYFAGLRWLPDNRVHAIAVAAGERRVFLATDRGLGILTYEPYTLLRKAAYYEKHLEEWGQKRLGITHKLEWDEPSKRYVREISDNDGGYTGNYLAAQCYRYAVTRDPAARRDATNTFHALRWLETMTGIPGFPARSVWAKGETGHKAMHGSGGLPAEWHDTADGRFEWKGDTSSDEICSHFYAFALFLELVAEGPEVDLARRHLARIATHLMEHQWQLVDIDGKPTRWGRWDPEYFETDEGKYDRGLQCLEILSFFKAAHALTGEARFGEAYRQLVKLGYPQHTLRERNTFPPENVLHFLDELAFWSYWNLIRYEEDPELRSLYRRSLERTYEVIRVEHQPWFNFMHAALTGHPPELGPSLDHLRGWPLDLRVWSYRNSNRADLRTPPGYSAPKGGSRAFPPRETEPMRWDHWTMQADGGAGGNDVVEPSAWLLAYWMGRHHGFIAAPTTTNPALLTVEHTARRELGALPYDGPPRP